MTIELTALFELCVLVCLGILTPNPRTPVGALYLFLLVLAAVVVIRPLIFG